MLLVNRSKQNNPSKSSGSPPKQNIQTLSKLLLYNPSLESFPSSVSTSAPPVVANPTISPQISEPHSTQILATTSTEISPEKKSTSRFNFTGIFKKLGSSATSIPVTRSSTAVSADPGSCHLLSSSNDGPSCNQQALIGNSTSASSNNVNNETSATPQVLELNNRTSRHHSGSISIPSDDDACLEIRLDECIEEEIAPDEMEEDEAEDYDDYDDDDGSQYNSKVYSSAIKRKATGATIRPSLSVSTTNTLIQKISGISLVSTTPTPTSTPSNLEFQPSTASPGLLTTEPSNILETPNTKMHTPSLSSHNLNHDSNLLFAPTPNDRYTSFTSECISLQNSEMTSTFSADIEDGSANNASTTVSLSSQGPFSPNVSYTPPPLAGVDSSATITPSRTPEQDKSSKKQPSKRKTLRTILRYANYNKKSDHMDVNKSTIGQSTNDDFGVFQDLETSEEDPNTYLLDTESDLNFDPSQEESANDYKKGGYHPVTKGEVYYSTRLPNREYIILQKLGWGHFSTVWLAKCRYNRNLESTTTQQADGSDSVSEHEASLHRTRSQQSKHCHHRRSHSLSRQPSFADNYLTDDCTHTTGDVLDYYVAIKFVKSHKTYSEAAEDEIRILRTLDTPLKCPPNDKFMEHYDSYFGKFKFNLQGQPVSHEGYGHIMKLLDDFHVKGPNGSHICMVFEVLGENMLHFLYKYKSLFKHGIRSNNDLHKLQLDQEIQQTQNSFLSSNCPCGNSNIGFPTIAESCHCGPTSKCSCDVTLDPPLQNIPSQPKRSSYANLFREQLMFVKPQIKPKKQSSTISKLSLGLLTTHHNESSDKEDLPLPNEPSMDDKASIIIKSPISDKGSPEIDPLVPKHFNSTLHESLDLKKLHQDNLLKLYGDLKSYGGLPLSLAKSVIKQILKALDYMHHCGVIHTDLKPENILIEIKDVGKLIKYFEHEKLSKLKQFYPTRGVDTPILSKHSSMKKSSLSRARGSSVASTSSLVMGSYKKSKNSIVSKFDSPIRCSKPLFTVSTENISFKDVGSSNSQKNPQQTTTRSSSSISGTSFSHSTSAAVNTSSNSSYISVSTPLQTIPSVNGSTSSTNLALAAPLRSPSFLNTRRKPSTSGGKGVSPKTFSLMGDGHDQRRSPFIKRLGSASSVSTLNSANSRLVPGSDFSLGPPALSTSASVGVNSIQQFSSEEIHVKIADLGNATYAHSHFTNQIQTRQYRAPETILRHDSWGASTDMWSLGCIIFELITGDYLFDPHNGTHFDKDEDHLAQIIELLGEYPPDEFLIDCYFTTKYFKLDENNEQHQVVLKNISNLKVWKLRNVLIEKYKFDPEDPELELIVDLILKCLRYNVEDRYDAHSLLKHPWFTGEALNEELANDHDDIPGYSESFKGDDDEEAEEFED